jgi:hypothetical protein
MLKNQEKTEVHWLRRLFSAHNPCRVFRFRRGFVRFIAFALGVTYGEGMDPTLTVPSSSSSLPQAQAGESEGLATLEVLLRRLPRVVRQLRVRQADRPAFRVIDELDVEDLLRSILPLHFDDVRPDCRSVSYSANDRTDFLLMGRVFTPQGAREIGKRGIAVVVKRVTPEIREPEIESQLQEDVDHHEAEGMCGTLVCFVYDPDGAIGDPRRREREWSRAYGDLDVRCIVAT